VQDQGEEQMDQSHRRCPPESFPRRFHPHLPGPSLLRASTSQGLLPWV
jgi:hypothetical protein